jgi:hypothetical protein
MLQPPKYIDRPPSTSTNHASISEHQVDHLFLLVGGNPLPNWTAATTLLKPGGKAYLIHTQFSPSQAQNLQAILNQQESLQPAQLIDLGDDQGQAFKIREAIRCAVKGLSGTVGLNYTGATKPMSVHAYRIIAELYPNAVFSYLDSTTSQMMIDSDHDISSSFILKPKLSFQNLFQLHSLSWRDNTPPTVTPVYPEAAAALMRLYQDKDAAKGWRSWCNKILKFSAQDNGGNWLKESQLQQISALSMSTLSPALKTFAAQYLNAKNGTITLTAIQKYGFRSLRQVCEWLDGIWIEHYTLAQIQQVASEIGSHESAISFHITNPQQPNQKSAKFEFDAAFMRDYQLFAISCTTSAVRSLCKSKLLEASVRAKQLGGSEARIALVCCNDKPGSLKEELESDRRNPKVTVFGRKDLPFLSEKICEWVKTNA